MAIIKGMGGLQVDASSAGLSNTALYDKRLSLDGPSMSVDSTMGPSDSKQVALQQEVRAARLAILYEQEALVSGYLDDANARRQFEDAGALKSSLEDL